MIYIVKEFTYDLCGNDFKSNTWYVESDTFPEISFRGFVSYEVEEITTITKEQLKLLLTE